MNNHFNKRGRNHQRRRQGVNPNRALDSNGPDVRIRGTAQQIYDKYLALARDATSGGDRVKAENYFQHAEHYFRVLRSIQGPQAPSFEQSAGDLDYDSEQPQVGDVRSDRQPQQPADEEMEAAAEAHPAVQSGDESEGDAGDGHLRAQENRHAGDQESGRRRRRRPRRPREENSAEDAGEETESATA